jgi:hypothetical protein
LQIAKKRPLDSIGVYPTGSRYPCIPLVFDIKITLNIACITGWWYNERRGH